MEIKIKNSNIIIKQKSIVGIISTNKNNLIKKLSSRFFYLYKYIEKKEKIKYKIINSSNVRFRKSTVSEEISSYCKHVHNFKETIQNLFDILDIDKDIIDKKISEISTSEKYKLFLLLNTIENKNAYIFINVYKYLDRNNKKIIKQYLDYLKSNDIFVFIVDEDINNIYYTSDMILIKNDKKYLYNSTKNILTNIDLLKELNIDFPDLPYITYLAKKRKNVKLFYHNDVRDIIKDIYKHV